MHQQDSILRNTVSNKSSIIHCFQDSLVESFQLNCGLSAKIRLYSSFPLIKKWGKSTNKSSRVYTTSYK